MFRKAFLGVALFVGVWLISSNQNASAQFFHPVGGFYPPVVQKTVFVQQPVFVKPVPVFAQPVGLAPGFYTSPFYRPFNPAFTPGFGFGSPAFIQPGFVHPGFGRGVGFSVFIR